MSGIFDYLDWRGDLSFEAAPFNPVDNVIFSLLAYSPLDGFVPRPGEAASTPLGEALSALLASLHNNPKKLNMYHFFKEDQFELLRAVSASERYRGIHVANYINHTDTRAGVQFAALTFLPERRRGAYIAFRGTDSSLTGWQEDFNMIFTEAVPAQLDARAYVEKAALTFKGPFYLGGHSKGGNLAVFAGAFCRAALKKRIIAIYNNDGPGFDKKTAEKRAYIETKRKVVSYIPQDSVIGLLFEKRDFCVIKSAEAGFMQHNPFLWEVKRDDLLKLETITGQSRFVNKTLMDWLESMDYEHRQKFIGAVFELLMSTNANSIPDLTADWLRSARLIIKSLTQFDKETRSMLTKTFASLFEITKNNLVTTLKRKYLRTPPPRKEPAGAGRRPFKPQAGGAPS